jgi:4-hydroxy-tetrahydrodipicolinate synthase
VTESGFKAGDQQAQLRGVHNIVLTPFRQDWSIDFEALGSNVDYVVQKGVHGVLVGGAYGEFPSLSTAERVELIAEVVRIVAGRVPVLACTAHSSTLECLDLTLAAEAAGATAAMLTMPYVTEVGERDIVHHFEYVASRVEIGLVIYNNPNIGASLPLALLDRLADIPNVIGIKQGTGSAAEFAATQELLGDRLAVMCGSDSLMLSALAQGMAGVTSTNSSFLVDLILGTYQTSMNGDWASARAFHERWAGFRSFARRVGQPAAAKAAMDEMGLRGGLCRPPLATVTDAERRELAELLDSMKVPVPDIGLGGSA